MQFRQLHALRRSGYSSSSEGFLVDSASIAWAFQSDCQDDLLNSVLPLEPTWSEMQKLGIGLWYTNVSQLRTWVCGYQQSDASELCIGFFVGIELCIFLYGFAKKQNGYKRSSKLQHCLSELFSAPDNLN